MTGVYVVGVGKQEHNSNDWGGSIDSRHHQIKGRARSRHKYGKDSEGGSEGDRKKPWNVDKARENQERSGKIRKDQKFSDK